MPPEEVVAQEETRHPTTNTYKFRFKTSTVGTYLPGGTSQGMPLDLGHESPKKFGIEVRFSNLNLGVFERQWEVIRFTPLYMTSQQIMSDEPDHFLQKAR